jgi:spore maturation protein CgeB
MKIALFYHSLLSDWNHGNAHFLRGVATELVERGHEVMVYEPEDSWSLANLIQEHGSAPIREFHRTYPRLSGARYGYLDLDEALDNVSLAIVHEWSSPSLVRAIGRWRARHPKLRLLFHDTHHRAVTAPAEIAAYDLTYYDGVLAYGEVLSDLYRQNQWAARVWTWHEAADTRVFRPGAGSTATRDLVWIGNWGDDEREAELSEFLMEPCRDLGLRAAVHGVRYPGKARAALSASGIQYEGWLANFKVPAVFAESRVTVHVPRRPYATKLRGIPTIRPFEALACGIPMVSAPWDDAEGLFTPGEDYLVARSGRNMRQHLRDLLHDAGLRDALASHGLNTIEKRHTCAHRVDELLGIYSELRGGVPALSWGSALAV